MTSLLISNDLLSNQIDRGTRRACDCQMSDCNGHCNDYLHYSQLRALDPTDKDSDNPTDKDDFTAEMIVGSTVKQEALSREQWIRWIHGLPLDEAVEMMPIGAIEGQMLRAIHSTNVYHGGERLTKTGACPPDCGCIWCT